MPEIKLHDTKPAAAAAACGMMWTDRLSKVYLSIDSSHIFGLKNSLKGIKMDQLDIFNILCLMPTQKWMGMQMW